VTFQFESPLDNFLGFERAPRTNAERKKVADMIASLKAADGLFFIDPSARCSVSKVQLTSAALNLGSDKGNDSSRHDAYKDEHAHAGGDHADIDATIVFSCTKANAVHFIALKLFEKYPHLHTINAQVASRQGQFKRTLKAASPKLDLGID
jgi:hypothetical protein